MLSALCRQITGIICINFATDVLSASGWARATPTIISVSEPSRALMHSRSRPDALAFSRTYSVPLYSTGHFCSAWLVQAFDIVDVVFITVFTVELFLNLIVHGLRAFMRSPWNIFDL